MRARERQRRIYAAAAAAMIVVVGVLGMSLSTTMRKEQIAVALTGGDASRAPPLLRRYGCAGCHNIPGIPGADGLVGPPLGDLRQRVFIAGKLPNTADNLVKWIVAPTIIHPASAMPNTGVSESEARDIAAYLYRR
jgi:cytochrome c